MKNIKNYINFLKESMHDGLIYIGSFDIETGDVVVSDPCYKIGTWCQGILHDVLKGKWNAYVRMGYFKDEDGKDYTDLGIRNLELITIHEDYDNNKKLNWINSDFTIGVDSGQAGIYDYKYYRDDNVIKLDDDSYFKKYDEFPSKEDFFIEEENKLDPNKKINVREIINKYDKIKKYKVYKVPIGTTSWYDLNCLKTSNIKNDPGIHDEIEYLDAGVIPYGCVSSSGSGDGTYICYYASDTKIEISDFDPHGEEIWDDNVPKYAIKINFDYY